MVMSYSTINPLWSADGYTSCGCGNCNLTTTSSSWHSCQYNGGRSIHCNWSCTNRGSQTWLAVQPMCYWSIPMQVPWHLVCSSIQLRFWNIQGSLLNIQTWENATSWRVNIQGPYSSKRCYQERGVGSRKLIIPSQSYSTLGSGYLTCRVLGKDCRPEITLQAAPCTWSIKWAKKWAALAKRYIRREPVDLSHWDSPLQKVGQLFCCSHPCWRSTKSPNGAPSTVAKDEPHCQLLMHPLVWVKGHLFVPIIGEWTQGVPEGSQHHNIYGGARGTGKSNLVGSFGKGSVMKQVYWRWKNKRRKNWQRKNESGKNWRR